MDSKDGVLSVSISVLVAFVTYNSMASIEDQKGVLEAASFVLGKNPEHVDTEEALARFAILYQYPELHALTHPELDIEIRDIEQISDPDERAKEYGKFIEKCTTRFGATFTLKPVSSDFLEQFGFLNKSEHVDNPAPVA